LGVAPKLNFVAAAVAAVASVVLGCSRSGAASSAPFGSGLPAAAAATPAIRKLEREMFERLNRDRAERGLPRLRYDERCASVARSHSTDMRDHHFFSHESPTTGSLEDRLNRAGYLFLTARENLVEAPDVQTGEDSLLRSPGHYANIVATDITNLGIGVVQGGVEAPENLTVTQVFATPGRDESAAVARNALVGRLQSERARRGLSAAELNPLLNELAQEHISELGAEPEPSELAKVGERVSAAVAAKKAEKIRGVAVAAQVLPDTRSFELPTALLGPKARFGLAVRKVENASGRPMVQLLLLVAQ
jgi:uncharacterized protein YkwD